MTQVRGKLVYPDGTPLISQRVTMRLADSQRAFVTADHETVVREVTVMTNVTGEYLVDLPGATGMVPSGSRWVREVALSFGSVFTDILIVPNVGGPFWEQDLIDEPIDPIPTAPPSNLLDYAAITASVSKTNVVIGDCELIAGTTVVVPDVSQPVLLRGHGPIGCQTASSSVIFGIVPAGGVYAQALDECHDTSSSNTVISRTLAPEVLLDPHSPGQYQLFVSTFSFTDLTIRVDAAATKKAWLMALAV